MTRSRRRALVAWARSADRDLERIYAYIGLESQKRAANVVTSVIRAVDQLEFEPELGAVAQDVEPVGRCRHLIVATFRVIYQVGDRGVVILRIWDARRDPDTLFVPGGPGTGRDK